MLFAPLGAMTGNSTIYNDIFQGLTFGNSLEFDVTLTGLALTPNMPLPMSGSTFAFSLYDAMSHALSASAMLWPPGASR